MCYMCLEIEYKMVDELTGKYIINLNFWQQT